MSNLGRKFCKFSKCPEMCWKRLGYVFECFGSDWARGAAGGKSLLLHPPQARGGFQYCNFILIITSVCVLVWLVLQYFAIRAAACLFSFF